MALLALGIAEARIRARAPHRARMREHRGGAPPRHRSRTCSTGRPRSLSGRGVSRAAGSDAPRSVLSSSRSRACFCPMMTSFVVVLAAWEWVAKRRAVAGAAILVAGLLSVFGLADRGRAGGLTGGSIHGVFALARLEPAWASFRRAFVHPEHGLAPPARRPVRVRLARESADPSIALAPARARPRGERGHPRALHRVVGLLSDPLSHRDVLVDRDRRSRRAVRSHPVSRARRRRAPRRRPVRVELRRSGAAQASRAWQRRDPCADARRRVRSRLERDRRSETGRSWASSTTAGSAPSRSSSSRANCGAPPLFDRALRTLDGEEFDVWVQVSESGVPEIDPRELPAQIEHDSLEGLRPFLGEERRVGRWRFRRFIHRREVRLPRSPLRRAEGPSDGAILLADFGWSRAVSGYGPLEIDRANGEPELGDRPSAVDAGPAVPTGYRRARPIFDHGLAPPELHGVSRDGRRGRPRARRRVGSLRGADRPPPSPSRRPPLTGGAIPRRTSTSHSPASRSSSSGSRPRAITTTTTTQTGPARGSTVRGSKIDRFGRAVSGRGRLDVARDPPFVCARDRGRRRRDPPRHERWFGGARRGVAVVRSR